MLHPSTFTAVNFGDEVLIVDTELGLYFSLRGCAVDIWSLIESGVTVNDIIAELGRRYDGTPRRKLLRPRVAVSMICLPTICCGKPRLLVGKSRAGRGRGKADFRGASVERFTDMQDLLLLDPIHDISDIGWPQRGSQRLAIHPAPDAEMVMA